MVQYKCPLMYVEEDIPQICGLAPNSNFQTTVHAIFFYSEGIGANAFGTLWCRGLGEDPYFSLLGQTQFQVEKDVCELERRPKARPKIHVQVAMHGFCIFHQVGMVSQFVGRLPPEGCELFSTVGSLEGFILSALFVEVDIKDLAFLGLGLLSFAE